MSEMMWYAQRGQIEAAWRDEYETRKAESAEPWELENEQWLEERDEEWCE